MEDIKVILGDITYPKSQCIIIPATTTGLMNRGIKQRIKIVGGSKIEEEAKNNSNKVEIGKCFITYPGRLNRRGIKKIYHCVVKRLESDLISVKIVKDVLIYTLKQVVKDDFESVGICGLGIEPGDLDSEMVAKLMIEVCEIFEADINIKIIDDNKKFINYCKKEIGEGE